MDLAHLKAPQGANKKKKRVGRGDGSGHGGTSCRGHKGQRARAGGKVPPHFEGGQMPMVRRLPKRGFRNIFREEMAIVNLDQLKDFPAGSVIDKASLLAKGTVKKVGRGIKLLGRGEIDRPLTVKLAAVSSGARKKIEAAGGTVLLDS
ncbi:MAG TPA: 50S ribosomal protein L15 [Syntrophales bacterium]|nr:50S ribosomal protein L15 [Syntrophales bacterium]HOL58874.1 50S ribosomal protein L15 [Syntrophales bacterium]HPO35201.1 50S ribosomal protein L15 [Syntrophales bacterium]